MKVKWFYLECTNNAMSTRGNQKSKREREENGLRQCIQRSYHSSVRTMQTGYTRSCRRDLRQELPKAQLAKNQQCDTQNTENEPATPPGNQNVFK